MKGGEYFVDKNGVRHRKDRASDTWIRCDEHGNYINDTGKRINAAGHLLDDQDRLIDHRGRLVNEEGQLVNEAGQLVDEDGALIDGSANENESGEAPQDEPADVEAQQE